jgi:cyanophycin synthetase
MTRAEVEAAYVLADAEGSEVLVERFVRGNEHRLLVVGGKLAAAARGESLSLIADGKSTLRQLIDSQINTDPRRGATEEFPLNVIVLDDDATVRFELERQGYTGDSVPPANKQVLIQRNGNVAIDITDEVHPDTAEAVALAARIVGLDIAGVDLVAQDISRPLAEQGGAIVEINAGPSLIMHLKPAQGQPRPVGKAIVDSLFDEQNNGRIPIVGISGTNGQCLTAYLVAKLLHLRGNYVGLACSDGLFFAHRQIDKRNCANWVSAQKILLNRSVEAAVIESSSDTILTEGLGYDRCQVGIVLHIDEPKNLEQFYIETPEQVCNVLRTQIDVVLSDGVGVLNADDPLVAQMAEYCDGEVIYFAQHAAIDAAHLQQGGRAVLARDGTIILVTGAEQTKLMKLNQVPALKEADCDTQIESVLAAVATAWALDISHELIRAGLTGFEKITTHTKGNA